MEVRKLQQNKYNKTTFITIPKEFVDMLGWRVGDAIKLTEHNKSIQVERIR